MTKALRIDGVDISHWQSGSLDFLKAKAAGAKWVYHKATEGTGYTDPKFASRRAEVTKEGGLPFGAYHFARPSATDALKEAKHFLSVAKPKGGDMRPMLDLEDRGGLSQKALTAWVKTFVTEVQRVTGVPPFIYTPFDLDEHFNCPLWVARYNNENAAPRIPKPWTTYTIWQFSNGVYGVPKSLAGLGNVDLNTMNGDAARLTSVFRLPSVEKPPPTKKSIESIAREVIDGKWGNGATRVKRLKAAGYDPKKVQAKVNLILAPKPPSATITLRVGTANIKNYPDMSPAQVLADMRKVRSKNLDLVLWQEIGEPSDFMAIIEAFGNTDFGNTDSYSGKKGRGYVGGNVITWRRSLFTMTEMNLTKIGPTMGKGTAHPSQWMVHSKFDCSVKGIPSVEVFNIHFIVGAHNADTKPYTIKHKAELVERWNGDHAALKKAVLAARAAGSIAIYGGDFNASGHEIPAIAKDARWIVGGGRRGIDHVGILLPKGITLGNDPKTTAVNLNSDHDLKWTSITLNKE